ncbi:YsnF/AvaK domain-containing protein [Ramlibacter rhizophilus]|nr:YsnF/AvaK domain-containing protein [Ramlibacter rhizophilus]
MDRTHPSSTDTAVVPVLEERLSVEHRVTDTGAVRLRKQVEEVTVRVDEAVVSETAEIERVRLDRVVTEAPAVRHEGEVLVIPVVEERVITRTELVLVEEIRVTRRRETRPAHADVPLRRERVIVERFDPDTQQWRVDEGA